MLVVFDTGRTKSRIKEVTVGPEIKILVNRVHILTSIFSPQRTCVYGERSFS